MFLEVAAATGARRGEICALRWGDIDFTERTVCIERSAAVVRGRAVFVKTTKTTKTGSVRRVSITSQAIDALRFHRERAERAAVASRRVVDPDDFVYVVVGDAAVVRSRTRARGRRHRAGLATEATSSRCFPRGRRRR